MKTSDYVVGLMFDESLERVALIRKIKPAWQAGKLNGAGGSIEDFDSDDDLIAADVVAIVREWKEETGMVTKPSDWLDFLVMRDIPSSWHVHCFCAIGDIDLLESKEEEKLEIVNVSDITLTRTDVVDNLCWMIGIALNVLKTGRPTFAEVIYPN